LPTSAFRFRISESLTAAELEPYTEWVLAMNNTLIGIESGACRLVLRSKIRFPTATLTVGSSRLPIFLL